MVNSFQPASSPGNLCSQHSTCTQQQLNELLLNWEETQERIGLWAETPLQVVPDRTPSNVLLILLGPQPVSSHRHF